MATPDLIAVHLDALRAARMEELVLPQILVLASTAILDLTALDLVAPQHAKMEELALPPILVLA